MQAVGKNVREGQRDKPERGGPIGSGPIQAGLEIPAGPGNPGAPHARHPPPAPCPDGLQGVLLKIRKAAPLQYGVWGEVLRAIQFCHPRGGRLGLVGGAFGKSLWERIGWK